MTSRPPERIETKGERRALYEGALKRGGLRALLRRNAKLREIPVLASYDVDVRHLRTPAHRDALPPPEGGRLGGDAFLAGLLVMWLAVEAFFAFVWGQVRRAR